MSSNARDHLFGALTAREDDNDHCGAEGRYAVGVIARVREAARGERVYCLGFKARVLFIARAVLILRAFLPACAFSILHALFFACAVLILHARAALPHKEHGAVQGDYSGINSRWCGVEVSLQLMGKPPELSLLL